MDVFDVHRRDLFNFDEFMNLKNPGFGGPSSAIAEKDDKGNRIKKEIKLDGYRNVVERHPAFSHEVWNPTYKAMGSDLVYKQEVGKNPYDYAEPYENMGIPVVDVTKGRDSRKTNESLSCMSFDEFNTNEQQTAPSETEIETPVKTPSKPGTRPGSPTRPPKRRVNPAPKNADDSLVQALATELDITTDEAAWLLADDSSGSEVELDSTFGEDGEGDDFYADIDYDSEDEEYSFGAMGSSDCGCS